MSSKRRSYGDPDTRRRILEVTRDLVVTKGSTLKLSEVATEAGVSRQALYLHFGDRQGLLLALVSHMDEQLDLGASLAHVLAATSGKALLERAMGLNTTFWSAVEPVARVLRASDDAALQAAWRDRMTFRRGAFLAMVRRLRELGELDPRWTDETAGNMLYALSHLDPWTELTRHLGWDDDAYARTMADVLARALLAGS